jgi:hypothetical protein
VITTPAIDQLERLYDIRLTEDECHLLAPAHQLDAYDAHRRRVLLGAFQTCLCPACGHILCQRSAAGMPLFTSPLTVRADDDYSCPDCAVALTWRLEPLSGSQWFTVISDAAALAAAERRYGARLPRSRTLAGLRAALAARPAESYPYGQHPDAYPDGEPWGPDNPAPAGVTVSGGVTRGRDEIIDTYAAYCSRVHDDPMSLLQWEGWQRQVYGIQPSPATAAEAAVWTAWHALAADDPHPANTVATVTGLPLAQVAAIIGGEEWPGMVPAGETPAPATTAVWAVWNALADDDPHPVRSIAAALGLEPAAVAAIVYPFGPFGPWDDSQEPPLLEAAPDEEPAPPEYDRGDAVDDEGGASEARAAAAWAEVDQAERERDEEHPHG